MAWLRPVIWACMDWLMTRPAASSAALLMRRPEDRRWMFWLTLSLFMDRFMAAMAAVVLVLMRVDIGGFLPERRRRLWAGGDCS